MSVPIAAKQRNALCKTLGFAAACAIAGQLTGKIGYKSFGATQFPSLVNATAFLGTQIIISKFLKGNDIKNLIRYIVAVGISFGVTPMITQYLFKNKVSFKQSLYLTLGPAIVWLAHPYPTTPLKLDFWNA